MKVAAQSPVVEYERSWRLTADPHGAEKWRNEVALAASDLGADSDAVQVARLGVTELISNVHKHVGPAAVCQLVVEKEDGVLCVRLFDTSHEVPQVLTPDRFSEAGRGLWLLREMAEDIGYLITPGGKWVWLRCPLDSSVGTPGRSSGPPARDWSPTTRNSTWSPS